jgi:hypothetical protein
MTSVRGMHPVQAARSASDRQADCACLARLSRCPQQATRTDQLGRTVSRACAPSGHSVISGDTCRTWSGRGVTAWRFASVVRPVDSLPRRSIGSLAISTSVRIGADCALARQTCAPCDRCDKPRGRGGEGRRSCEAGKRDGDDGVGRDVHHGRRRSSIERCSGGHR